MVVCAAAGPAAYNSAAAAAKSVTLRTLTVSLPACAGFVFDRSGEKTSAGVWRDLAASCPGGGCACPAFAVIPGRAWRASGIHFAAILLGEMDFQVRNRAP